MYDEAQQADFFSSFGERQYNSKQKDLCRNKFATSKCYFNDSRICLFLHFYYKIILKLTSSIFDNSILRIFKNMLRYQESTLEKKTYKAISKKYRS